MKKRSCLTLVVLVWLPVAVTHGAYDVTKPGDTVIGVPNDGDWPPVEAPPLAIDDNVYTKYLHFKGDFIPYAGPTGLRVTPSVGSTVVTGLTFTTANDVPGRDPTTFELSGSNYSINGPYTVIAVGTISDFAGVIPWPRLTKTTQPIRFANSVAYKHYQLLFPSIRGPVGGMVNSMQIAEVELLAGSEKATAPNPPDGAMGVVGSVLTWTQGDTAVWHNVYVGTSPNLTAADLKASQLLWTTFYYLPGFQSGVTYYWRVDESDGTRTYKGDVWKFTTRGRPGGLKGQYFGDRYLGNLVLTRIDPDINFWWGQGSPDQRMIADNFSVRWTGEVEIPVSGPYRFITRTDDGVRLYVNNRLVIDNWTDHSLTDNWSEPITLVAGQTYPLKMEFYENQDVATAVLEWQSPSTPRQVVPSDLLSPPYRASNPRPANLSTVPKNAIVILSWSPGENATEHDVYFGNTQQKVQQANTADATGIYRGRRTNTSYPLPDTLQSGNTYYWRIDEWNTDGTVSEGAVWSFTVGDYVSGDDFETNDFSKFPWERRGDGAWHVTSAESHGGLYSAVSGSIGDDETSVLSVVLACVSGDIAFYRKVSSEPICDLLIFSIDGVEKGRWSGDQDWAAVSFPAAAGTHTFEWVYTKDSSSTRGSDAAWIDDITFPLSPAPAVP
jgi:hypothetical protein